MILKWMYLKCVSYSNCLITALETALLSEQRHPFLSNKQKEENDEGPSLSNCDIYIHRFM